MIPYQPSLFDPPAIQRAAIIPSGAVFHFAGRALRVRRVSVRASCARPNR